ncbi:hypothetical protein MTO96_025308 [Rhipicephalus appendiculatus]
MKAEALTDSKKEILKSEVVPVDAKGNDMEEEATLDIKVEKMKADEVASHAKEGEMKEEVPVDAEEEKMKGDDVPMDTKDDKMKAAATGIGTGEYFRSSSGVDATMGLQELIFEAIEELGDPDELVNNEDLIVLKLEQACTNKRILPEEIGLSGDARRLSMSQQAFVTGRAFLGNLRCSAALFAGCSEFLSSKAFFETAKVRVLKNVRTLVIVHNRNSIFNLVTWFPTVTTIVLYHNLRLHAEKGVITSALPLSRVEQLLGTMPALGVDHLSLGTHTLQSLFSKCPKLASVMSSDMDTALSVKKVITVAPKHPTTPIRRKALFLGRTCIHYTGIPLQLSAKSADAVEKAHQHFPEAEHIELTAACESAIRKVASYTKATHLSLFSTMPKDKSPFEPYVTEVLTVLRLVHLSLTHFCDVRLSAIAKLCPPAAISRNKRV